MVYFLPRRHNTFLFQILKKYNFPIFDIIGKKDEKVYRNVFEDVSPDNKTNGANPSNGYSVV